MASTAIDLLIGKLVAFVENEGSLIGEFHDDVQKLKDELEIMKSFLKDAESRGDHREVEKTWTTQVRNVAIEVEDIIAEFSYNMNKMQSQNQLYQIIHSVQHLWERRQFAKKLQKISIKVKEMSERKQRYTADHLDSTLITSHDDMEYCRKSSRFLKDDRLVGIESAKCKLLGWLMNEEKGQTVISVVGMAGSGKTTLVANTVDSNTVKQHFDCYAFVTVSQTYRVEDLLRTMVKEFYKAKRKRTPLDLSEMSYTELVNILESYLSSKRYVIVLDDVWNTNLWEIIKVALPDSGRGSRVMLTTQKEDVARFSFGVRSHVHNVLPLEESEAWDLFCRKAFSSQPTKKCPIELKSIAKDFVQKCKGLPLGIVALGALLSTKELKSEWKRVYNNLSYELSSNPVVENVKSILLLSFQDLPYPLRYCFLYCCLFPEDYNMRRKQLIDLWIAEGLVQQVGRVTPLEIADSYLLELTRRSMLQVSKREPDGNPTKFKMHDLLRELALSISETENFCTVITGQERNMEIKACRLSLQGNNVQLESFKGLSKVRTLFVFSPCIIPASLSAVLSSLKWVTILNLQGAPIAELPLEIGHFFNLIYLNLSESNVKKLPDSIGNLCNLQRLDISHSKIETLPCEITKLKRLKILNAWKRGDDMDSKFYNGGVWAPSNICELKNLHDLAMIKVGDDLIKRLRYMTQLRALYVANVKEAYENDLCISIERMKLLEDLCVITADRNEVLCMDALSSVPPFLNELLLAGKLEKVPHWFHSLQSLTFLVLYRSRLTEDCLPSIQALTNLRELWLRDTHKGNRLCFSSGFQKLSHLRLDGFPKLKEIIIEKGVMPCIRKLRIGNYKELKSLPHGIQHLSNLRKLYLDRMPAEFIESIRGEGSVDRHKIQHIPIITHWIEAPAEGPFENLS